MKKKIISTGSPFAWLNSHSTHQIWLITINSIYRLEITIYLEKFSWIIGWVLSDTYAHVKARIQWMRNEKSFHPKGQASSQYRRIKTVKPSVFGHTHLSIHRNLAWCFVFMPLLLNWSVWLKRNVKNHICFPSLNGEFHYLRLKCSKQHIFLYQKKINGFIYTQLKIIDH